MKPFTLFKILRKRIEAVDPMLILSRTRDNSYSRATLGTYYLHDVRQNKILRTNINLLQLAKEMNVSVILPSQELEYA